ncbi:calcium channel MID1, partial [Tremellales sp. Uapishka_1]
MDHSHHERRRTGSTSWSRRKWTRRPLFVLGALIVATATGAQTTSASTTTTTLSTATSSITLSTTSSALASSSAASTSAVTPTHSLAALPTTLSLALDTSSPSFVLAIPATTDLFLTFNLCSLSSNTSLLPNILITTTSPNAFTLGTRTSADSASGGLKSSANGFNRKNRAGNVWSIEWDLGFGNWTYSGGEDVGVLIGLGMDNSGVVSAVDVEGDVVMQIGVSAEAPLHTLSTALPFLGDTTADTALLFSSLLSSDQIPQPSYPNYTLPSAQVAFSAGSPPTLSSLSIYVVPTSSSPSQSGLDNSMCAVTTTSTSTGSLGADSLLNEVGPRWMRVDGEEGWRWTWAITGLLPQGNYTAWVVNGGDLSGPIWFSTKEESFPCQLLLPTDICPAIGYAVPLAPNATAGAPLQSIPTDLVQILTANLEAFSTSLLSQACGRDYYSHVATCLDCHSAYRDWLCRILLPRCASSLSANFTIPRNATNSRNPGLNLTLAYDYDELLPCEAVCNKVDKSCPVNLGFRCPIRGVNAEKSYAFMGNDADVGDGSGLGGSGDPSAYDRWGNRWCNG